MEKSRLLTGAALARLTGKTDSAINKARKEGRLFRDETLKKYDPLHPANSLYIEASQAAQENNGNIDTSIPPEAVPDNLKALYEKKLRAEIRRIEAMSRKYETELAIKKKDLIPAKLMAEWMGYFRSGIESNFLTIGSRAARGNIELRNRVEKLVKTAIEKTLEGAAHGLRNESEQIIKSVEATK